MFKNQKVIIIDDRVISRQNGSTPGIYKIFKIFSNKIYKLELANFEKPINRMVNIKLWITINNLKTEYFKNLGNNENIKIKLNSSNTNIFTIKIGLLFTSPRINDYFIIKDIKLTEVEEENKENEKIIEIYLYGWQNNRCRFIEKNGQNWGQNWMQNWRLDLQRNSILRSNRENEKNILVWQNNEENLKKIELTVALPSYNSDKIIWLALESLKNQQDIEFGWELIIWEEYGKSKEIVESYYSRLPSCQRIIYKILPKKISLLEKWIGIAKMADGNSRIFVLQAADDYSPPRRLAIHYIHFKNRRCYLSTQLKGIFYDIYSRKKVFYIGKRKKNHLNMAYRIDLIKRLKKKGITSSVDYYIKSYVEKMAGKSGEILIDEMIDANNWKYGFFTDGYNNISHERKKYYDMPMDNFYSYGSGVQIGYLDMRDYIPGNVINFLRNL